jgi:hypothetical protein
MCDAVAVIPVTVMWALTEPSGLIVTVPDPDADVVTGGTSLLPDSLICSPPIACDIAGKVAMIPAAPTSAIAPILLILCTIVFMNLLR